MTNLFSFYLKGLITFGHYRSFQLFQYLILYLHILIYLRLHLCISEMLLALYHVISNASNLLYGVHHQLFICFTEYTANCLFALRITPPIVYLPNRVHHQLFICLTEYTANCLYVLQSTRDWALPY